MTPDTPRYPRAWTKRKWFQEMAEPERRRLLADSKFFRHHPHIKVFSRRAVVSDGHSPGIWLIVGRSSFTTLVYCVPLGLWVDNFGWSHPLTRQALQWREEP